MGVLGQDAANASVDGGVSATSDTPLVEDVNSDTAVSIDLTDQATSLISIGQPPAVLDDWSVVLCGFTTDRWDHLCAAIDSVLTQRPAPGEVIVVVDYNEVLRNALRDVYGDMIFVIDNEGRRGPSGGRNTGIRHATGAFVAFIDDDAVALPGWLQSITAPFDDPEVIGVGGLIVPAWERGDAPAWMPDEFLWVYGCTYRGHPQDRVAIRAPIGANMAFRRQAMVDAGGFDGAFSRPPGDPSEPDGSAADVGLKCEETDLAVRITRATGRVVVFEPSAVVHHSVGLERTRYPYFLARCLIEGRSKAVMALRNGLTQTTAAERSFIFKTLIPGLLTRIGLGFRGRDGKALQQAVSIIAGLGLTGVGFIASTARNWVRPGAWRVSTSDPTTFAPPAHAERLDLELPRATGTENG